MKKLFLVLFCVISFLYTTAQNAHDYLRETWQQNVKTTKLAEGVTLQQAQIDFFDSKQSISVIEIQASANIRLGINDVSDTLITTSQLCKQVDALCGINASFFDMRNGGAVDFVRVGGKVLHKTQSGNNRNNAAMLINEKQVSITMLNSNAERNDENINSENVIVAGPMIMQNHTPAPLQTNKFNDNRHPRTFVGVKDNGNTLLVTVDGRNANAAGMSIPELYILAQALDCRDAMNFDGGGSTAMYVRGAGENGIVNYPSDNRTFDHNGERRVANVIYVKEQKPFKFALFTDIHTGGANTSEEDLARCVDDVNSQSDIDFVLVNGDVTENGLSSELETVKKRLDRLNVPYYAIAGNHETKWTESGHTRFAQVFGDNKVTFEHNGIKFIGFSSGPVLKMGDAHVSPNEVKCLKETLESMEKPRQPIIVFTHVPFVEPHDQIDNGHELADILRQYNVRTLLHGHYHHNRRIDADGIPAILCRSTLRANKPVGGYTIFNVDADSITIAERNPVEKTLRQWESLSMNKTYYSSDNIKHNLGNDSINALYPNVNVKWQVNTDGIIVSTAAVENEKVIVGNELGEVFCLNVDNGNKIWKFNARNAVYSAPAIADGRVVFGSCDSSIYCLDIADGKKLWEIKTNHTVMGAPIIEKNIAYIGGSDGSFRAINIKNGKLVWKFDGINGYIESKPLLYDGKVIFGAWDTNLYALNKKDGKLAWKWNNGHARLHFSPAACIPVATNGRVYFVAPDRYMTALDAKTGEIVWRTNQHKVRETIGISEDKSRIYARCFVDTMFCISTAAQKYEELWIAETGYTYDINPSMPIEKDGVVFFVTKNGMFVACNATDGKILWKHKFRNTIIATLTPLSNREVIFTTHDGIIGRLANKE